MSFMDRDFSMMTMNFTLSIVWRKVGHPNTTNLPR